MNINFDTKINFVNLIVSLIVAILVSVGYGLIAGFEDASLIVILGCIAFVATSVIYETVSYFYNEHRKKILEAEKEDLLDRYFYHNYSNGISRVEHIVEGDDGYLANEFSYIDKSGNYITDEWFDIAVDFNEKGTAQVARNGEFYVINKEGKVISKKYDSMMEESNYIAKVVDIESGKVNFINTVTGKELWKNWKEEKLIMDDEDVE